MLEINQALINALKKCRRLMIFTGAGVSAESGIRTFRDEMDGLWKEYSVEDVVSIEGYRRNPELVWRWHEWFKEVAHKAKPNPAHRAIAAVSELVPQLDVVTQNIDGLHQRAGSKNVILLHGDINRIKCSRCNYETDEWEKSEKQLKCPKCGAGLRHDIVWFGEQLPEDALTYAMHAATTDDVVIAIGTSSVVYPAAQIPFLAKQSGARVVVVNPDDTPLTQIADDFIKATAGVALPELFKQTWGTQFEKFYEQTPAG